MPAVSLALAALGLMLARESMLQTLKKILRIAKILILAIFSNDYQIQPD
ncbi:MAG: hypothetical protein ACUVUF_08610 [Candidatus Bathycorpusculaceae bacterium]